MNVLIACESKHAGVSELSTALAEGLRIEGFQVHLSPVDQVERLTVRMVGADDGDDHDWAAVQAWSQEISLALRGTPHPLHASA